MTRLTSSKHMKGRLRAARLEVRFLALVLLLTAAAVARAATPFNCIATAPLLPAVRVEADADRVGDYVVTCTGGTPTAAGAAVAMADLSFTLNTNITSRLLAPGWSEALLMIDDPPPASQSVCGAPGTTVLSTGICTILGNGTGAGVYDGSPGRPNVFQARVAASNSVAWTVPLDPPPAGGQRVLRITNVRCNLAPFGGGPFPGIVNATLSVTGAVISGATQIVAFGFPGLSTSVPVVPTLNRCTATNAALFGNPAANGTVTFTVRLAEEFGTSWLTRTTAAFIDANTSPPPAAQDVPGLFYPSETGFYNPAFPALAGQGNLALAGLADQGTRLFVSFTNVPGNLKLFTQTVVLLAGTSGSPTGGVARLVSVGARGSGPFQATPGNAFGIAAIPIAGGDAQAVFEILKGSPLAIEHADVPIYVAFTHAQRGTAKVAGSFAPISTVAVGSQTAPVPRFINSGVPEAAFVLPAPCP